jgi:hypothetical protein
MNDTAGRVLLVQSLKNWDCDWLSSLFGPPFCHFSNRARIE